MSTDYRILSKLPINNLFSGAFLERFGLREEIVPECTSPTQRCLVDSANNYLWVICNDKGMITGLTRYGLSNADAILASVVTAFDVEVVSEHEPEYWGFETQEEWDAWQHEVGRESWHVFYKELLAVIRGEPNTFSAGTLGAIYARLAQKLAKQEPALLRAENETAFMEKLGEMYLDEKALGFPADKQEAPF